MEEILKVSFARQGSWRVRKYWESNLFLLSLVPWQPKLPREEGVGMGVGDDEISEREGRGRERGGKPTAQSWGGTGSFCGHRWPQSWSTLSLALSSLLYEPNYPISTVQDGFPSPASLAFLKCLYVTSLNLDSKSTLQPKSPHTQEWKKHLKPPPRSGSHLRLATKALNVAQASTDVGQVSINWQLHVGWKGTKTIYEGGRQGYLQQGRN